MTDQFDISHVSAPVAWKLLAWLCVAAVVALLVGGGAAALVYATHHDTAGLNVGSRGAHMQGPRSLSHRRDFSMPHKGSGFVMPMHGGRSMPHGSYWKEP